MKVEQVFSPDQLVDLRTKGYGVGTIYVGDCPLHLLAVRVVVNGDEIELVSTERGAEDVFDGLLRLMGEVVGNTPRLLEWEDRQYLLGACPWES